MKTLIKTTFWKILNLFYANNNLPLHLREISRRTNMNESAVSRYLNILAKENILVSEKEGNLKKFRVSKNKIPEVFPFFDLEKFNQLPLLRKNALKFYLNKLDNKPVFIIVFGSTAKGNYRNDSDLDILEIVNSPQNTKNASKYAEHQTGIKIQNFQMNLNKFKEELKLKKDKVIQSALESGFPFFNSKYFYEVVNE
jgi:predicted nucleotidyltransferase